MQDVPADKEDHHEFRLDPDHHRRRRPPGRVLRARHRRAGELVERELRRAHHQLRHPRDRQHPHRSAVRARRRPPADNNTVIIEFLVDDVDDVHQNLVGFVEDFINEPTTMPWGNRSLLFRDPDGNLINFFTPSPRPPSTSSPADAIAADRLAVGVRLPRAVRTVERARSLTGPNALCPAERCLAPSAGRQLRHGACRTLFLLSWTRLSHVAGEVRIGKIHNALTWSGWRDSNPRPPAPKSADCGGHATFHVRVAGLGRTERIGQPGLCHPRPWCASRPAVGRERVWTVRPAAGWPRGTSHQSPLPCRR